MSRAYILNDTETACAAARMKSDANYIGFANDETRQWLLGNHVFVRQAWEDGEVTARRLQQLYHRLRPGDILLMDDAMPAPMLMKVAAYAKERDSVVVLVCRSADPPLDAAAGLIDIALLGGDAAGVWGAAADSGAQSLRTVEGLAAESADQSLGAVHGPAAESADQSLGAVHGPAAESADQSLGAVEGPAAESADQSLGAVEGPAAESADQSLGAVEGPATESADQTLRAVHGPAADTGARPLRTVRLAGGEHPSGYAGALALCLMNGQTLDAADPLCRKAAACGPMPWYDEVAYG